MPAPDPLSPDSSAAATRPLSARVAARVSDARLVLEGRAAAAPVRGDLPGADRLAASVTRTPDQVRDARALRRAFLQLSDRYEQSRSRSGSPESPAVREADARFRRELSFAALVAYAGRLEELHIAI